MADFIANAVNRYVGVWIAAPGLVQLELNGVRWFCEIIGYPPGSGGILPLGGSLASCTAVVTAPGDRLPGGLPMEEVVRIGHSHNRPIVVDAAGEVYPTDKLSKYVKMGADLVAYGAKYFGAVNSSGLLTGRKDLIDAARSHSFIGFESADSNAFGRPMKIDRQEVVAVYAALREWLSMNHEDRFAGYEVRVADMREELRGVSNIELSDYPERGPVEGLLVKLDVAKLGKNAEDVVAELRAGNPSIWVRSPYGRPDYYPPGADSFAVRMQTLREGGEQIIAQRLIEILGS